MLGAAHLPWWESLPALGHVSLVERVGAAGALAVTLGLCALLATLTRLAERRRHGRLIVEPPPPSRSWRRVACGPWPLAAGAVGLAAVNVATLALAGRPWGVTSAFALWGSKILGALGVDVASWPYWSAPARAAELRASLVRDVTSVMDVGILLGALLAAGLAGRFAPTWRVPPRSLAAALLGGVLLGYGARLAYGCNIGAFFGGVVSGSLHGWVWLVAAFLGNMVGTRWRPAFGLAVERASSPR